MIGYEDVNLHCISARSAKWHCSANMRKKFKMVGSQSPRENQVKKHVFV